MSLMESNGIIYNIAKQGGSFLSTVILHSFEVKSQTQRYNSLQVIYNSTKNAERLKRYIKGLGKSCGVYALGGLSNFGIINAGQFLIGNDELKSEFLINCFNVTFPTINFFSSLPFIEHQEIDDHNNNNNNNQTSIIKLIKNNPKLTITCLSYYIGINLVKTKINNIIIGKLLNYIQNNSDQEEISISKYYIIYFIYTIYSNPIAAATFGTFLVSPYKNIANQYCKQLISTATENQNQNKDQFNFIKLNPINIMKKVIKEKGLFSSFYSGLPFIFLSDLKTVL